MRRLLFLVCAVALAGCGGSDPAGTVTPPPPSATPASIAVSTGNGQQAEPGAAVAIKPAVLVTDASGQPVSGAAVTFAVDSGGGSLSATSAVTGSNGIATAGTWTLGSAEGRNILKVTVGSLAVLRIAATAVVAESSFPAVTIGTGGGSINVSQAGPINGFTLGIPGGAFSGSVTATVSYSSNMNIPRTPTLNPISPLITIGTATVDYAAAPLTIHVNASVPANTFPVILAYDAASGASEVLTTIAWDANGVTALTGTLNGAAVIGGAAASLRTGSGSLRAPDGITVIVDAIPTDLLMRDYDSGYRPGADDWEFPTTQTELARQSWLGSVGPSVTSLWYFTNHRGAGRLNSRFMLQPGVPLSDRAGIRWTAVIGALYDASVTNEVAIALAHRAESVPAFDQNQLFIIRSRFARSAESGTVPQPQLVVGFTPAPDPQPFYFIAYRVTGNQVYVADPFAPGDVSRFLQFPAGTAMATYGNTGASGTTSIVAPLAVGLTSVLPIDQFPTTYAQVLDGSIGQAQFPTNQFHTWDMALYDTMFVVDTLRIWDECAKCAQGWSTTLMPAPSSNVALGRLYSLIDPATLIGTFPVGGFFFSSSSTPHPGTDVLAGLVVQSGLTLPGVGATLPLWLDWHSFTVRRLQTSILPAAPTQFVGTPLALTHQVNAALLPSSVSYSWDFGDQTPKVTVANNPAMTHTYAATGTYTVTGQIIDNRNAQVIAQSTTQVTVVVSSIQFKIAGSWDQNFTPPDGNYGYTDGDGQRGNQAFPGLDVVLLSYDNGSNTSGVTVILFLPTGTNLNAGQLFQQRSNGAGPTASVFGLILAQNLSDLANSAQSNIGAGGTLTITSVAKANDGATVFGYSLSTSNGTGGSLAASGFGRVP